MMILIMKYFVLFDVAILFCLTYQTTLTKAATIGTWNIQNFGTKKAADKITLKRIVEVIREFDLIAIQEISDITGKVMTLLLEVLEKLSKKKTFKMFVSKRVGEGGYAEQYGILYNSKVFKVSEEGIYDGKMDFKRPPYFVTVSSKQNNALQFGFGTIHTSPPLAVEEISNLADASDWYKMKTGIKNVMLLGDFNCGCTFVRPSEYQYIELYTRPEFQWLIPSTFDTTVSSKTNCPYDRIVVTGKPLYKSIVPNSATVWNFQEKFSLSEEEALKISDHFPVSIEMDESKLKSLRNEASAIIDNLANVVKNTKLDTREEG